MTTLANFPAYRGVGAQNEIFDFASDPPGGSFTEAGDGDDIVDAGNGADTAYGQGGNDTFIGFGGNDTIYGDFGVDDDGTQGEGADFIVAMDGNDVVFASFGNDYVNGGAGADRIDGGRGDDLVYGAQGDDVIYGRDGDDILFGGTASTINLTYVSSAAADTNGITDTARAPITYSPTFVNNAGVTPVITVNTGSDYLSGGAGNDTIDGGDGIDTMLGGTGDDTFFVDELADIVVERAGEGTDIVRTRGGYALATGTHIERLTADDTAQVLNFNLFGNELAQEILGNAGKNRINGLGGADIISGFAGNDTFVYSSSAYSGVGAARDTILDFEDFGDDDTIDLSGFAGTLVFMGDAAFDGLNQVRAIQSGADVLIQINAYGNLAADVEILLANTDLSTVTASDFLLV